ncbi:MAG: PAS domain S-box protein [Candidatus Dormiibacterota bacterium]
MSSPKQPALAVVSTPFDDSGALLAAIVDASDDAIFAKTMDGTICSWNTGAERLYGYTAVEAIGRNVSMVIPAEHASELLTILSELHERDATQHFDTKRVRKDGTVIDVSVSVSPIRNHEGVIVGASTVARDVTELNRTRRQLLESELRTVAARSQAKAEEEISRAKGEVVSLVSHELRSPLASILGFTELLYTRELTDAQRKVYLGVMLREARRLTDLINDVLQLQRLEGGHQKLNLATVDLRALIQRAVEAAGEDDRRPIGMILPQPLPLVRADPDALLQVLGNFLSNARKFSPLGGTIRISAREAGDVVQVSVRDEGLGIPPEAIDSLFRKFYRVDSPDRRLIRGSGLGLSINQKIIEGHGGTVEVSSQGLGKGSNFGFSLPIAMENATHGDVLIVEDQPAFARVLEAELAARGLTAVWASDAETAERLLMTSKPRAIVLDLKLPGVQGEEFLARLRADHPSSVPVVVLTMRNLKMAEIMALQSSGATAVLPKEAGAPQAAVTLIADALFATKVKS